jgi:hypothetical protein
MLSILKSGILCVLPGVRGSNYFTKDAFLDVKFGCKNSLIWHKLITRLDCVESECPRIISYLVKASSTD